MMSSRAFAALVLLVAGTASAEPGAPRRRDYQPGYALSRGQYSEAAALAAQASARSPGDPWPHYERGVALRRLGRTDEAVSAFLDAAARFPESDVWDRSIATYARARALDESGRCEQAVGAYGEYATLIRQLDAERADAALTSAAACRPAASQDPSIDSAASAAIQGDPGRVLSVIASAASASPWLEYNRGVAFSALGRTNAAVDAYRRAEVSFASNEYGRSIAIWGRARALGNAGRCAEAKAAYEQYATLVHGTDSEGAELALARARGCVVGAGAPLMATR